MEGRAKQSIWFLLRVAPALLLLSWCGLASAIDMDFMGDGTGSLLVSPVVYSGNITWGDLAPGVFLIYTTDNRDIKNTIKYLNLGDGPNYLIYKPYHMTSIETPLSIARAYFEKKPWIVPEGRLVSEVATVAKKELKGSETLDGVGGFKVYGTIELYDTAKKEDLLPIGLAQGCVLINNKKKGEPVYRGDVEFKEKSLLYKLRELQEGTIG